MDVRKLTEYNALNLPHSTPILSRRMAEIIIHVIKICSEESESINWFQHVLRPQTSSQVLLSTLHRPRFHAATSQTTNLPYKSSWNNNPSSLNE